MLDERGLSDEVVTTRVEATLRRRFPGHPVDDVRLAVQHALRAFEAARVRTYLVVLVERTAAERLATGAFGRGRPLSVPVPRPPSGAAVPTATSAHAEGLRVRVERQTSCRTAADPRRH